MMVQMLKWRKFFKLLANTRTVKVEKVTYFNVIFHIINNIVKEMMLMFWMMRR